MGSGARSLRCHADVALGAVMGTLNQVLRGVRRRTLNLSASPMRRGITLTAAAAEVTNRVWFP